MSSNLSSNSSIELDSSGILAIATERGQLEKHLDSQGLMLAGVDEVGRGCLAGPVYTACTVLDYKKLNALDQKTLKLIRDSKTLSRDQRRAITPIIHEISLEAHVTFASVAEIENLGIVPATFLAMSRALRKCRKPVDVLLIDGKTKLKGYSGRQVPVVKGDQLCFAIAAASILAKEARDDFMREQAKIYPVYGFDTHVGYGTKVHLEMIRQHGIIPLHRRNFAPISTYYSPAPRQTRTPG